MEGAINQAAARAIVANMSDNTRPGEILETLDELARYGAIRYTLTPRPGRDPKLDVFEGPRFGEDLPQSASSEARLMLQALASGLAQALVATDN